MELKTAIEKQPKIISLILKNKISHALKELSGMVYNSRNGNYISDLENLEQTYQNILKYSFEYTRDPERDKIFAGLKRRLIELTDDIVDQIKENSNDWYARQKSEANEYTRLGEQEKSALIDEMSTEKEFSSLLESVDSIDSSQLEGNKNYTDSLEHIFSILWLTNNFSEGEILLARKLIEAKHIPWYDKSIIISAITLSMSRHFDHSKAEILFDAFKCGEHQVWQRALVGLLFIIQQYDSRLELYPEIINRLKSYEDPDGLGNKMEQVILQLIRAQETEKVTQKIQNEIIPEVMKMRPDIEEKLKLDELLNPDKMEEKNPDWQEFFSDSPEVYKKLEEFSMMQMDGSDVFMGAFSMLKRFGFFEKTSNWFLPFYKEHPEIQKSINGVEESFDWKTFFEGIEQAPVMCNSDKYSFSFNIGFMPDMQKTMMLEMFNAELNQMKEVFEEDGKHDTNALDKTVFTQYLQDMYRFFKLYQEKANFFDLFNLSIDITKSKTLKQLLSVKNIRQIGEFYFKKNYFDEAREIFFQILEDENQYELIEKVGFCYQKTGDFDAAIKYYEKAEILDANRLWLQKKLGFCYHSLKQFDTAIEYYSKVEHHEPENFEVQIMLGQLHIDKEDFEAALKYYFKVEYLKPDLVKVQRPIAWCNFMLGKLDQAIRYFTKVIEHEGKRSDYLNLGHCLWAKGEARDSIEQYRNALKQSGNDTEWFNNALDSDSVYLRKYGIDDLDVSLMSDFISLEI